MTEVQSLKIAIIGSAPSSVALAPYDDLSWQIWSCSPGARPHLKRTNAHYELHFWEPDKPWFSPDYVQWLRTLQVPVVMLHPIPEIPTSVPYPKEEIMRRYGPGAVYFYTSSIAWMLALAIEQNPTEITLFGVDMSASEEIYSGQRAGCQYFIGLARARGIKVTIPGQSDLDRPTPLYGFCELDPMHTKLLVRREELNARLNDATNRFKQAEHEMLYLRGAAEDVNYVAQTWIADPLAIELLNLTAARAEPSPVPAAPVPLPDDIEARNNGLVAALRERSAAMMDAASASDLAKTNGTSWASTKAPNYIAGA